MTTALNTHHNINTTIPLVSNLASILQPRESEGHTIYVDIDPNSDFSQIPKNDVERFDARVDKYDEGCIKIGWRGAEESLKHFISYKDSFYGQKLFGDENNSITLVDVGAANGHSVEKYRTYLRDLGYSVCSVGVDLSQGMLFDGRKKDRFDHAIQASATDVLRVIDPQNVDIVNAIGVSEFFSKPKDADKPKDERIADKQALKNFARNAFNALRPGGVLNFTYEIVGSNRPKGDAQWSTDFLCDAFKNAGFEIFGEPRGLWQAWQLGKSKRPVSNGFLTAFVPAPL